MKGKNIISGYNGIMPLDLTYIDPKYHEVLIKQHSADIIEYKLYQKSLKPELQYENSIERVLQMLKRDRQMTEKRNSDYLLKKHQEYMLRISTRTTLRF